MLFGFKKNTADINPLEEFENDIHTKKFLSYMFKSFDNSDAFGYGNEDYGDEYLYKPARKYKNDTSKVEVIRKKPYFTCFHTADPDVCYRTKSCRNIKYHFNVSGVAICEKCHKRRHGIYKIKTKTQTQSKYMNFL